MYMHDDIFNKCNKNKPSNGITAESVTCTSHLDNISTKIYYPLIAINRRSYGIMYVKHECVPNNRRVKYLCFTLSVQLNRYYKQVQNLDCDT